MSSTAVVCPLPDLGVLRFHGTDAVRFLQGQMSNDITQLAQQSGQLAGYHNPQGRVLALLRLAQPDPDTILAILPVALAESTTQALRRFVLRAKVTISNASPGRTDSPQTGEPQQTTRTQQTGEPPQTVSPQQAAIPQPAGESQAQVFGYVGPWPPAALPAEVVPLPLPGGTRGLLIDLSGNFSPAAGTLTPAQWHALDLAAGLPQVYPATTAQFVAQMLNLDCVGGISFNKGCYTGQEIIARAHYRGRVKRRMRRFLTADPATLVPGDSIHLPDGRSAHVVDAVQTPAGHCEFLAVTGPAPEPQDTTAAATAINATELPLPYALPD